MIVRAFYLFVLAGTILGCAQNHFNIPATTFADKVKVIGIAPIFIDADSDISHPQKELLIPLIADFNRKYEPLLARKLQSTGNFYAVILQADEPKQLFNTLIARREKRDDASIKYNKYFWKNDEIGIYIKKNRLDAVMVIVVSGLTQTNKIYSSNLLTSLETNYNYLTLTAQILDPEGTVLWEYPNFRGRLLTYYPLINLQYPDFSESDANLSRKTEVRFKSLDGIRRTLEQKKSDWLLRETQEPEVYGKLFEEMRSLIEHDGNKPPADPVTTESKTVSPAPVVDQPRPTESLQKTVPVPAPATKTPVHAPTQKVTIETPHETVPAEKGAH